MRYTITNGTVSAGGQTILSHIDFEIKGTEKIAIVGEDVIIGLSRNGFQKEEGHSGLVLFNVTQ
jgi:hypothetical protein